VSELSDLPDDLQELVRFSIHAVLIATKVMFENLQKPLSRRRTRQTLYLSFGIISPHPPNALGYVTIR